MSFNIGRSNYARRRKKMVPIDTSGPDAEIDIEEIKDEVGCRNRSAERRTRNRTRK